MVTLRNRIKPSEEATSLLVTCTPALAARRSHNRTKNFRVRIAWIGEENLTFTMVIWNSFNVFMALVSWPRSDWRDMSHGYYRETVTKQRPLL